MALEAATDAADSGMYLTGQRDIAARQNQWRTLSLRHALLFIAFIGAIIPNGASTARWQADTVPVYDYTAGGNWGPIIERQVDALNEALPRGAPRFRYRDKRERSCDEVRRDRAAISICSTRKLSKFAATSTTRRESVIAEALIYLREDQISLGDNRVCHELMHAVTAVLDAYGTQPESCVRGSLSTFSTWDVALLHQEYE